MATVYSAEDVRHARQVAIQLLRPELSAILGGERFPNEIRVTAHLQHPHILPLLDSGDAGGLLYYIMPYVEGESLRSRIRRERRLPIPDAVRIARDVADQRTQTRVTFDRDAHDPMWSTDGRSIYYITRQSGAMGVYRVGVGSQGPADSIYASTELQWTGQPLPNGDLIATGVRRGGSDIVRLANGGRCVVPVVATPYEEGWPAVSPDGRWLPFASNQSGTQQVYVRRLDGDGGITQVSVNGGSEPVWSRSGRELYYRRPEAAEVDLMAASAEKSPAFRVLGRTALFSAGAFDAAQPHANFDVSPNGRTFIAVRRDASTRIAVLQNVPELVRRSGR